MGGRKHLRFFHAQRGQAVNIEKAAVVDFFRCHAPVTQPVPLLLEQGVQQVKTLRLVQRAVEQRDFWARNACTCGFASVSAARRRLMTSFPRWRSASMAGSVSRWDGKYLSAVRMLSYSASASASGPRSAASSLRRCSRIKA